MLRDMIINELGTAKYEQLLSRHLYSTCAIEASTSEVVTEVNTFLLLHGFDNILDALNDTVPIRDIVIDFSTVVKPCLTYASAYKGDTHV